MREIHLFVCYGARSLDAAARIAKQLDVDRHQIRFMILFQGDLNQVPEGIAVAVLDVRRFSEWTRPFAIARWYRRFLKELRTSASGGVIAYVPHPFELPANDLIFSNPRVIRRELLPDGLINYTKAPHIPKAALRRLRYEVRVFLRRVSARLVGLRYQILKQGHITQFEFVEYDRVWSDGREGLASLRGAYRSLPAKDASEVRPGEPSDGVRILIVDQEIGDLVNAALEARLRLRLADVVAGLKGQVYYKAHPRGVNRADSMGATVVDLTSPMAAEQLTHRIQPTHVVGFYSTALLALETSDVERIAVLPEARTRGVKKVELLSETIRVLEARGVRIVRVE